MCLHEDNLCSETKACGSGTRDGHNVPHADWIDGQGRSIGSLSYVISSGDTMPKTGLKTGCKNEQNTCMG